MAPSPFNDKSNWLGQSDSCFALINQFPVSRGHTLIIPLDTDVHTFTDLTAGLVREHYKFARFLSHPFDQHFHPDGYNIGWNVGFSGGQSIAHAHMHIIPRYNAVNAQFAIAASGGVARMPLLNIPDFNDYAGAFNRAAIDKNSSSFAVSTSSGNILIYTNRAVTSFSDLTEDEFADQLALASRLMEELNLSSRKPDGYNLGWDSGAAAGQVGDRLYLQLVPRYQGDIGHPRGGIIRIIPDKAWPVQTNYCDPANTGKNVAIQRKTEFPFTYWTSDKRENTLTLS